MPKVEKNIYYKINDKESRLVVTKKNGDFFRFRIDTPDIPIFKKYSWFMKKDCYLYTRCNGKDVTPGEILFHPKEKGYCFDHIDRNPFNYSRENLKYGTLRENIHNRYKPRTQDGKTYGIDDTESGKYRTRNTDNLKKTYDTFMEAAEIRVKYNMKFGKQSKLEAVKKLEFNDVDEFDYMLELCSKPD